jgi:hypothetical protein
MPELTRRLTWPGDKHATDDWSIFYGDIGVGRIFRKQGSPHAPSQWRWTLGFHPGRHPRDNQSGDANTFGEARAAWMTAWEAYLPDCTEEQFEEYRDWHRFRYGGPTST